MSKPAGISERLASLPWPELEASLWHHGYAQTGPLLDPAECEELRKYYADGSLFRSRIDMARYRFGLGEYQYFNNPLPPLVAGLRHHAYPRMAALANAWTDALGGEEQFPVSLDALTARCHALGQTRPTPLLLRYETDGYNCLHQDLYGDLAFPLQMVVLLSEPHRDFTGGEFLLVEQRPRAQSAGTAISPALGEAVLFTTRHRPVRGARGWYRANMKHGVSRVRSGTRYTLGVIFHDAK